MIRNNAFIPFASLVLCISTSLCIISCKKNSDDPSSDSKNVTSLNQSVFYKFVATEPSPADSAEGIFSDSLKVSRLVNKNDKDFLSNIPTLNANIINNFPGFSFGYNGDKTFPYFEFTAFAFPEVTRQFLLNKTYQYTTIPGSFNQKPLFLGYSSGNGGMTYFVDNVLAPDGQYPPLTKTFTSVTFTKKIEIPLPPNALDTLIFCSGHISGYSIDYYNYPDTLKYKHRLDFVVEFYRVFLHQG